MEDILDVYHWPYDPLRPLVCLDEASKQLLSDVRKPLPPEPGWPKRVDCEYRRDGTANLFMLFEPLGGHRRVKVTDRRTKRDFAEVIRELVDVHYPQAEKIVLVMDQLNTHTPGSLYEAFEPLEAKRLADRIEIHYTPKHGSWLNMAEIEFSVLARQCLNERMVDKDRLIQAIMAWQKERNQHATRVNWQFTTDKARIKLKRLYPSLLP